MSRRRTRRVALALLALGAGLLAQPARVDAATVTKLGWWYRTSNPQSFVPGAAQPPVPLPDAGAPAVAPSVAEGSILVEGTPEGATAIAALTYVLREGESAPVLTITPSDTSNVPPDAVVLACRAAVDWTSAETQPGRWQDKPLVDCGRSVNGIANDDGTLTFALGPLVSGTELDVVLVPGIVGQTPAGNVGSAFSLSFDTAEGAVLATTGAPSSSAAPSTSPTSFVPASSASPSSAARPSGSFVAPTTPVVQPALEPQDQAPTVPAQPMLAAPASTVTSDDAGRAVAFVVLLAGAALAGLAHLTPARPEDALVGLGRFRRAQTAAALAGPAAAAPGPVEGGLGRFARVRTGPPAPLS